MSNRIFPNYKIIGTLILVLGVLAILFTIPLSAAENAKINLPDGLYMYDSRIWALKKEEVSIRFRKYFVVKNNIIYSSQEAMKKFGASKLNELFTENKNYKILFGGENIGKIYDVKFNNEGYWNYKENLYVKNIKEGPAYWKEKIYLDRLGSAAKCIAVPEKYKEVKKKVYTTIQQEELDKISKLVKGKLFHLVKNRKEITDYQLKHTELNEEYVELLDKISNHNDELYIGIYRYIFKISQNSRPFTIATTLPTVEIAFSVKKDNVYVITSDYAGTMKIQGMLDIDGCGEQEIIIEKVYGGLDEAIKKIEIYKQKTDGNWTLIQKNEWKETS